MGFDCVAWYNYLFGRRELMSQRVAGLGTARGWYMEIDTAKWPDPFTESSSQWDLVGDPCQK